MATLSTMTLGEALDFVSPSFEGTALAQEFLLTALRRNEISAYYEWAYLEPGSPALATAGTPISSTCWSTAKNIDWEKCTITVSEAVRCGVYFASTVFIRRNDLELLLKNSRSVAVRARPMGRPTKWDWEAAFVELHRLDAEEGTENKTQAILVRHLADWFAQLNGGESPADSQIKERVKRWQEVSAEK